MSMPATATPSPRSTLREGLSVVRRGIKGQPRWFTLAVLGATVYGVMTGLMAWAIGWVVDEAVAPAIEAGRVTASQLWFIGGVLAAVTVVNVLGVIGRRLAGGIAMYNLGAQYRREVTRQYLRLPLSWHHRHPSGQLLSNANADVEATWLVFMPLPMSLGVLETVATIEGKALRHLKTAPQFVPRGLFPDAAHGGMANGCSACAAGPAVWFRIQLLASNW